VFRCWSYNFTFDYTKFNITEEVKHKIIEEGDKSKDTQYEFIEKVVREINNLDDQKRIIFGTQKQKNGVLVFNLSVQSRQMLQQISDSTTELKSIIAEDKSVLENWMIDKLGEEKT